MNVCFVISFIYVNFVILIFTYIQYYKQLVEKLSSFLYQTVWIYLFKYKMLIFFSSKCIYIDANVYNLAKLQKKKQQKPLRCCL